MSKRFLAGFISALFCVALFFGGFYVRGKVGSFYTPEQVELMLERRLAAHSEQQRADDDLLFAEEETDSAGEEIVLRISDEGYTTLHGDHHHFYYGLPETGMKFIPALIMYDGFPFEKEQVLGERDDFYVVRTGDGIRIVLKSASLRSAYSRPLPDVPAFSDGETPSSAKKNRAARGISAETGRREARRSAAGLRAGEKRRRTALGRTDTHDGYHFDPRDIVSEDADGYVVRHGDHFHYIFKRDVKKRPFSSDKPSIPRRPPLPSQPPEKDTPPLPSSSASESDGVSAQGLKKGSDMLSSADLEKVKYLSDLYGVPLKEFLVKGGLAVYPHGDHHHADLLSNISLPRRNADRTPSVDPEAEFEAELLSMAKMNDVPVHAIEIRDGMFIVPHGDHSHTYPIKSSGWKKYLENKIKPIDAPYVPGNFDYAAVKKEADRIKDDARYHLHDRLNQYRRVVSAVDTFMEEVSWGSNSTEGYIAALKKFEREYLTENGKKKLDKNVRPIPADALTDRNKKEIERLEGKIAQIVEYYDYQKDSAILSQSSALRARLNRPDENRQKLEADIDRCLADLGRRYAAEDAEKKDYLEKIQEAKIWIDKIDSRTYVNDFVRFINRLDELKHEADRKKLAALTEEVKLFLKNKEIPSGESEVSESGTGASSRTSEEPSSPAETVPTGSSSASGNPTGETTTSGEEDLEATRAEAKKAYWNIDQDKAPFSVYYNFSQRINDASTVAELKTIIADIETYLREHPEHRAA